MAKRPSLDELYEKALAAVKRAQAHEAGAGAALLEADEAFRKRCNFTVKEGTTRSSSFRPGTTDKVRNDTAFAKDYADYLQEDVYQPDTLRRCKSREGEDQAEGREARIRAKLRKGAIDLEKTSYNGPAAIEKKARGKEVIVYHGTSSKFLKAILREGLVIGRAKVDPDETPGIYLSARYSGTGRGIDHAFGYAERAAGRLGGNPLVLTIRIPWSELEWDTDDEDIASGNYQWRTDYVAPGQIIEINNKPRVE